MRVDYDSESVRDDANETWSCLETWYPTIISGIPLYAVKSSIVSGNDMDQGVLQKAYKHAVGFFQEHMSGTTNTIHMLFYHCVKYDKYITNIYMLIENSVTYKKCDHNIYILF